MVGRPTLIALIVVVAILPGCSGASENPGPLDEAGPTGAVAGRVVTDEQTPVANATVTVLDAAGTTLREGATDDAGRFRLDEVPAGDHRLIVEKTGFLETVRAVTVTPDAATEVVVVLEAVETVVARIEHVAVDGLIACGVSTPLATSTWGCGDANHKAYVAFNVTPGVRDTVHETVWESGSALTGQQLMTRLYVDGQMFDRIGGTSPLVRIVEGYDIREDLEIGEQVYVNFADESNPVVIAYQQAFTTHFTAFYHGPAPDGYSAVAA